MKNVYIVGACSQTEALFRRHGWNITNTLPGSDLVVFLGGADVSPELYGQLSHPQTYSDPHRDEYEKGVFAEARSHKIPMVGICRGGQFLNVMSGGSMYQHVTGHTRNHHILDLTREKIEPVYVSSTHHQMMRPAENGIILAVAYEPEVIREWMKGSQIVSDESDEDIEVVYYQETNCLCFQPHPEYRGYGEGMEKLFFRYIQEWCLQCPPSPAFS